MKIRKSNIIPLFVFFILSAFTISFSHNIIEQIGSGCEQHENHDFSKVIINANVAHEQDNLRAAKFSNCFTIPCSAYYPTITVVRNIHDDSSLPLVYYDKIYLTKTGSLLI